MPQPLLVVLTKPCNFCICVQENQHRPPPDASVFLENGRSETNQIVLLRSARGSGFSFFLLAKCPGLEAGGS